MEGVWGSRVEGGGWRWGIKIAVLAITVDMQRYCTYLHARKLQGNQTWGCLEYSMAHAQ